MDIAGCRIAGNAMAITGGNTGAIGNVRLMRRRHDRRLRMTGRVMVPRAAIHTTGTSGEIGAVARNRMWNIGKSAVPIAWMGWIVRAGMKLNAIVIILPQWSRRARWHHGQCRNLLVAMRHRRSRVAITAAKTEGGGEMETTSVASASVVGAATAIDGVSRAVRLPAVWR